MSSHHHHGILKGLSVSSSQKQLQTSMDLSSSSSHHLASSSSSSSSCYYHDQDAYSLPLAGTNWGNNSHAAATTTNTTGSFKLFNPLSLVASIFTSFIPALQSLLIPTCHWLALPPINTTTHRSTTSNNSSSRKRLLTGTFFGPKKGRVSFAIQETPRSEPILLLELATPTSHLVKEMASGMVRILLECDRKKKNDRSMKKPAAAVALWDEPVWSMYCNGHKLGYATARPCTPSDFHLLTALHTVSAGAGVMPAPTPLNMLPPAAAAAAAAPTPTDSSNTKEAAHPEIMYMRAKFDRVIGNRDSEALYMINPDCTRRHKGNGGSKFNNGGPELSIFLLRI